MPGYTIAVLKRAFRVLRVMSEAHRPVALTEVSLTMGETKNSVFRILNTLKEDGFVAQVEGRWTLGVALHKLVNTDIENKLSRWKRAREHELRRECNAEHNEAGANGRAAGKEETPVD